MIENIKNRKESFNIKCSSGVPILEQSQQLSKRQNNIKCTLIMSNLRRIEKVHSNINYILGAHLEPKSIGVQRVTVLYWNSVSVVLLLT